MTRLVCGKNEFASTPETPCAATKTYEDVPAWHLSYVDCAELDIMIAISFAKMSCSLIATSLAVGRSVGEGDRHCLTSCATSSGQSLGGLSRQKKLKSDVALLTNEYQSSPF